MLNATALRYHRMTHTATNLDLAKTNGASSRSGTDAHHGLASIASTRAHSQFRASSTGAPAFAASMTVRPLPESGLTFAVFLQFGYSEHPWRNARENLIRRPPEGSGLNLVVTECLRKPSDSLVFTGNQAIRCLRL
jgi:hypothetical protein